MFKLEAKEQCYYKETSILEEKRPQETIRSQDI